MAIDTSVNVRAGFFYRWMPVQRMREILSVLQDDDVLVPNRVGNLTVCRSGHDQESIGFIDFHSEAYESFDETYELLDDQEPEGGQG